jgi:PIN domain nuclease of toxin-antitoxin system
LKLLLDTHALLWWLADDARLGDQARDLIADPGHDVLISTVSLWEIVVKIRVGKLQADIDEISAAIERQGFTLLGISPVHLSTLSGLPLHPDHRDPFDHLLVAQAITEAATLVSADRNMPRYSVPLVSCADPLTSPTPR